MTETKTMNETAIRGAIARLGGVLGADRVTTDAAERLFHAQDVYRQGELPAAVIRPATVEQLCEALASIADSDIAVVPRGGGMSYTDGYLPSTTDSVSVDLLGLDRIVEINVQDGYVTVEAGMSWKALHDALAPHGVRTPYWGPLSGLRATVGGAIAQGSMFLGSGSYGSVAENVLGLDVVLVDGSLLRVGSHALERGSKSFRNAGPDTMGLFLSDSGALGIKVRATLKLIPVPKEVRYASFEFGTHTDLMAALVGIAATGAASECFAFDPRLQAVRMKRAGLKADVAALGNVMKAAGGGLAGLKEGVKLAVAGRSFVAEGTCSVHVSCEGRDAADVDSKLAAVRRAAGKAAREVENTIPKVMRANPFGEVTSMLGPDGERWVPVHGIAAPSKAVGTYESCEAVFARHAEARQRYGIEHGYLMGTMGRSSVLIEPVLYWPDARLAFHDRVLPADYLEKLPKHAANPEAAAAVAALRADLAANFAGEGAASFQIGKFYPYLESLDPSAATLLKAMKAAVDPRGRLNPGSLGLG